MVPHGQTVRGEKPFRRLYPQPAYLLQAAAPFLHDVIPNPYHPNETLIKA
jgi:hypothetical protein